MIGYEAERSAVPCQRLPRE